MALLDIFRLEGVPSWAMTLVLIVSSPFLLLLTVYFFVVPNVLKVSSQHARPIHSTYIPRTHVDANCLQAHEASPS